MRYASDMCEVHGHYLIFRSFHVQQASGETSCLQSRRNLIYPSSIHTLIRADWMSSHPELLLWLITQLATFEAAVTFLQQQAPQQTDGPGGSSGAYDDTDDPKHASGARTSAVTVWRLCGGDLRQCAIAVCICTSKIPCAAHSIDSHSKWNKLSCSPPCPGARRGLERQSTGQRQLLEALDSEAPITFAQTSPARCEMRKIWKLVNDASHLVQ